MDVSSLANLDGTWGGSWVTYLEPGKPFDESGLTAVGTVTGSTARLVYSGSIGDDDVDGSMELTVDPMGSTILWTDSWHTAGNTERLTADADDDPSYLYGPQDDRWRWAIRIEAEPDSLRITHFNAPAGADPEIAVEMKLDR
jgi:hypothetical protein